MNRRWLGRGSNRMLWHVLIWPHLRYRALIGCLLGERESGQLLGSFSRPLQDPEVGHQIPLWQEEQALYTLQGGPLQDLLTCYHVFSSPKHKHKGGWGFTSPSASSLRNACDEIIRTKVWQVREVVSQPWPVEASHGLSQQWGLVWLSVLIHKVVMLRLLVNGPCTHLIGGGPWVWWCLQWCRHWSPWLMNGNNPIP